MKVAIPVQGSDLDAPLSLRFSRCTFFLFAEPESDHTEVLPNPAMGLLEDAGIQAARFVVEHNAKAVVAVTFSAQGEVCAQGKVIAIQMPGHMIPSEVSAANNRSVGMSSNLDRASGQ